MSVVRSLDKEGGQPIYWVANKIGDPSVDRIDSLKNLQYLIFQFLTVS